MQLSLFDGNKQFKIDKPIRLIELFAGIGSQAKALKNLDADFEHYRICEFDKYAVKSYNAVHGTDFSTSDITKITADDLGIVDTDKYCYIMTYSFPCQDLSNAGLGKGMAKGSGTRSGLLWEVERLLEECKELPQVLLMENVPAVIGKKNIQHFTQWKEKLESLGYKNKWQVLNAKDYGIPQNRARCFMVSLLGDYSYEFPQGKKLELRLKDMLETNVDEKYYLDCSVLKAKLCNELIQKKMVEDGDVIRHSYTNSRMQGERKDIKEKFVCPTLDTRCDCLGVTVKYVDKCNCVGSLQGGKWDKMHDISKRVYSSNGCSPTIHTCGGVNLEPKIVEPIVLDGYNQRVRADSEVVGTLTQNCGADLKRNGQGIIEPCKYELSDKMKRYINSYDDSYKVSDGNLVVNRDCAVAKTTREGSTRADASDYISTELDGNKNVAGLDLTEYRIRKLTPKECWRLMGFSDTDIDNAIAVGMSNAQLYKQAGNSIVVDVLMAIFKELL